MKKQFKILSPCGILGYGFPEESFYRGIEEKPDAIVVDAGSTDAGPHKLGAGTAIVSKQAYKRDLSLMVVNGTKLNIPVIVASAGGSGGKSHVDWTLSLLMEIIEENKITNKKIAIIRSEIPKNVVKQRLMENKVTQLGKSVPELTLERIDSTVEIVAQMGHEPIVEALNNGADIIICGRAYDPAPFAAVAMYNGYDPALSYHLGKILECAALCAVPGSAKDCMLGTLYEDRFTVKALNPMRKCTTVSVAAHTFYEKSHPYLLHGPGTLADLENCKFSENNGEVTVTNSKITLTTPYKIKLEGARKVCYRSFVIAGVRDPILISKIVEVEDDIKREVSEYYKSYGKFQINFINYGLNGVLGKLEPIKTVPHELGIMFEVLAETQDIANMVLSTVRSTFLHYGYEGRKSTAGNLAFPFAPSDVPFGPVYEFSVYHLMEVSNGLEMFPISYM